MVPNPDERLLTREQAALRAGVTYQTILLWERAARLHPVEVAGSQDTMIIVSELDQATARSTSLDPALIWRPEELTIPKRSA